MEFVEKFIFKTSLSAFTMLQLHAVNKSSNRPKKLNEVNPLVKLL